MPDAAAATLALPLRRRPLDIAILGEEPFGEHRTPHLAIALLANASWVLFPLLVLYRMCRDRPFTERAR